MHYSAIASIAYLAGFAMSPVIDRPQPDRLIVEGASFAGLLPEAEIVQGEEVLYGYAFGDGQPIEFRIDPMTIYGVYAFENGDGSEGDFTETTSAPTRTVVIEHIVEQRIYWERQYKSLADGSHPAITSPVPFGELSEAIVRVYQRMGETE